jgi:hypothetical protein
MRESNLVLVRRVLGLYGISYKVPPVSHDISAGYAATLSLRLSNGTVQQASRHRLVHTGTGKYREVVRGFLVVKGEFTKSVKLAQSPPLRLCSVARLQYVLIGRMCQGGWVGGRSDRMGCL